MGHVLYECGVSVRKTTLWGVGRPVHGGLVNDGSGASPKTYGKRGRLLNTSGVIRSPAACPFGAQRFSLPRRRSRVRFRRANCPPTASLISPSAMQRGNPAEATCAAQTAHHGARP